MKNIDVKKVPKYYVFVSDSNVGETERAYMPITDIPEIKQLLKDVEEMKRRESIERDMIMRTLNTLGVKASKINNAVWVLCQTLLNAKLLLDSEEYVAIESVDGYIKNKIEINSVYRKKYIDQFDKLLNGCHQETPDGIKEDLDKLNGIVGNL